MTVKIDPNIKKQRIFINKNGDKITEEQMFSGMGTNPGSLGGANSGGQEEEKST